MFGRTASICGHLLVKLHRWLKVTNQCVQSTQSGLFTLPYITNSLKRFGLNYVSTAYRKKKRVGKLVTAVFVFWAFYEVLIKFNFCVCVFEMDTIQEFLKWSCKTIWDCLSNYIPKWYFSDTGWTQIPLLSVFSLVSFFFLTNVRHITTPLIHLNLFHNRKTDADFIRAS